MNARQLSELGMVDVWDSLLKEEDSVRRYLRDKGGDPTALLMEVVRFLDARSVILPRGRGDIDALHAYHNDGTLFRFGLNPVLAMLLPRVGNEPGFPAARSTEEFSRFAATLLHHLGRIQFLRRLIEMTCSGVLKVDRQGSGLSFKISCDDAGAEIMDKIDSDWVHHFTYSESWEVPDDIKEEIFSLVYLWREDFIGYAASPRVDAFFLAVAMDLFERHRDLGGIHPRFKFPGISGADLTVTSAPLSSIYIKHIQFSSQFLKKFPDKRLENAITIWDDRGELVDSICEFANYLLDNCPNDDPLQERFTRKKAHLCLSALEMRRDNVAYHCRGYRTSFPALIAVRRNYVIRPISSVFDNMLAFGSRELARSHKKSWDKNIRLREDWFRSDLYALFAGNRYLVLGKPIQIFENRRTITDIDAAIIDTITGDVALFELKWQNPVGLEEVERRNKSSNLLAEVNKWSGAVGEFIKKHGIGELLAQMGLPGSERLVRKVFLFVLVRHNARFSGAKVANDDVAVASWHQFQRARMALGPRDEIFKDIYMRLKNSEGVTLGREAINRIGYSVAGFEVEADHHFFIAPEDRGEEPNWPSSQ